MSFPVAVQSAVFYVLACTPCTAAANRRKAKKQFEKEREERAAIEQENPNSYHHPSPFAMNPYWEEEMRMGPSLPPKGRQGKSQRQHQEQERRQRELQLWGDDHDRRPGQPGQPGQPSMSQRNLTSASQDSGVATQSMGALSSRGVSRAGPVGGETALSAVDLTGAASLRTDGPAGPADTTPISKAGTAAGSEDGDDVHSLHSLHSHSLHDTTEMSNMSMSALETSVSTTTESVITEGWNHKRYQREDEELWGMESPASRTHKFIDAIAKAGTSASRSAGRLIEKSARLTAKELRDRAMLVTEQDRARFYTPTVVHPPVNDMHPPVVVSRPANRDALRWMLQPPPPAKVMEGKVPVSRSTSIASSYNGRRSGSELSLGTARRSTAGSEMSQNWRAREAHRRRKDSGKDSGTGTGTGTGTGSGTGTGTGTGNAARNNSSAQRLPPGSRGNASTRSARSNGHGHSNGRTRSDSLASSVLDAAGSWSDDDGFLRTSPSKGRTHTVHTSRTTAPKMPPVPAVHLQATNTDVQKENTDVQTSTTDVQKENADVKKENAVPKAAAPPPKLEPSLQDSALALS